MTRAVAVGFLLGLCAACTCGPETSPAPVRFDVNDVSFLWPTPRTESDVARLIAVDETLEDGKSTILPQSAFATLLRQAQTVSVADSAGDEHKIKLADDLLQRSTWKIAGLRVDPSAPGTDARLRKRYGSRPQLRLIVQPVTFQKPATVTVPDAAIHLIFNYVKEFEPPAVKGDPQIAIPDKDRFAEIVKDLVALKGSLQGAGIKTEGPLGVHPGFTNDKSRSFADKIKSFLKKHLSEDRLWKMTLVGTDKASQWIFVALKKQQDGSFAVFRNPSIDGKCGELLMLLGNKTPVMPLPTTKNVEGRKGVSTASLFPTDDAFGKLNQTVPDIPELKYRNIPDLIANPGIADFFNTDCVSCHTESSRRVELRIKSDPGPYLYVAPPGISGIDTSLLPGTPWNVRCFGWGAPETLEDTTTPVSPPTATTRTANEAAESADFINKNYLTRKAR
jgi:hypothetical protein